LVAMRDSVRGIAVVVPHTCDAKLSTALKYKMCCKRVDE